MGCDKCEITAVLEGRRRHVQLLFASLEKLAWSDGTNCFLYQCATCRSLWESCAYEKAATEISPLEARRRYPDAQIK